MKIHLLSGFLLTYIFVCSCESKEESISKGIADTIIHDEDSFYYVDFEKYPVGKKDLPIGVFDSGTGGLTVLKAIVNYDENNNVSLEPGADGIEDFDKESFIYLGDQANMPYGNYSEVDKLELLNEHILKDVQFLLGNKYYSDENDKNPNQDKLPVKVLVIACNTATAYGKERIEDFLQKAKSPIKVIGVIDAGVRGVLHSIQKEENAVIGVLATAGTVSSKGYHNTILKLKKQLGYTGDIEVFSQGGVGIAEAVDEDADYFDKNLIKPRKGYKGPSITESNLKIDKTLLEVYNFNFDKGKMLCDTENIEDCSIMQINDAENYVRYHLVSLLENIRKSKPKGLLKSIILGCTHYPYMKKEISKVLEELYHYKNVEGDYRYRSFMVEGVQLIDPAIYTAKELFAYMKDQDMFDEKGDMHTESEFYISVPNKDNQNNIIDSIGRFPYEFKYGRAAGNIQEYVKVVPFSRGNISEDILIRFKEKIPKVYHLMENFNHQNDKCKALAKGDRI